MPYIVDDLLLTLCIRQSDQSVAKDKFIFHKCKKDDSRGDFACVFSTGAKQSLTDYLVQSVADSQVLERAKFTDVGNRVFVSLDRTLMFSRGLNELFSYNGRYGYNNIFVAKSVNISVDGQQEELSAAGWRVQKTADVLRRVVKCCGARDTTDGTEILNVIVNKRKRGVCGNTTMILVGGVVCKIGSDTSSTLHTCKKYILDELTQMSQTRLGSEDATIHNHLDSMAQTSLIFALFNGNMSKYLELPLNSVSSICKASVFVLYNYSRMTHIVHKFKKLESDGTYPPLPEISSIDFSLLTNSEEWDLMLNFVIYWPDVVRSTVSKLEVGEFKLHKILDFLKCLASVFSAYYRRIRILTDSRPHLLPVLFARMYLILGLMDVYKSAFDLLGIQPIQNM